MEAFEYASPKSKEDVVKLLAAKPGEAAVLAGGTDLLSLMKDFVVSPKRLVSLRGLAELGGTSYDAKAGLRIGARATLDDLARDLAIKEHYPSLLHAIDGVRSPQIQAMGTVGGDLCQRPRCWYFRAGFGLLAMKDGRSMVLDGDNRYHAILGNGGPAYFVNPSSLAPALIALGAKAKVFGQGGEREIDVAALYRTPKAANESELTLGEGEFLTEIQVPATSAKNATYEVREKQALDWPHAAAAVAMVLDGGKVKSARMVLGHVAPTPWAVDAAAAKLVGLEVTPEAAAAAAEAAVAGAKPLSMNGYKVQLARVAVKRAILRAAGMEVA
jgi:xanthine dehydrogenase YagS FAD-binding subunit